MSDADFRSDLESLINRHSQENGSNTPDFMLADYLVSCLRTFDEIVNRREQWYGRDAIPCDPPGVSTPVAQVAGLPCGTCGGAMTLRMWERPGGPPGNGYDCDRCNPIRVTPGTRTFAGSARGSRERRRPRARMV